MWTNETRDHERLVYCGDCKPTYWEIIKTGVTSHNKGMKHARRCMEHRVWVINMITLNIEHVYFYRQIQLGDAPPF